MYTFSLGIYDLDGMETRLHGPFCFKAEDTFADVAECLPDPPPGFTLSIKSWVPQMSKYIYAWPHTTIASTEENRVWVRTWLNESDLIII
jgi:hypothetical protein